MKHLPHIDGSGRGLEDGDCTECEASGCLDGWECPARLRAELDRHDLLASEALRRRGVDLDSLEGLDLVAVLASCLDATRTEGAS